jgi:hypothetical protein
MWQVVVNKYTYRENDLEIERIAELMAQSQRPAVRKIENA